MNNSNTLPDNIESFLDSRDDSTNDSGVNNSTSNNTIQPFDTGDSKDSPPKNSKDFLAPAPKHFKNDKKNKKEHAQTYPAYFSFNEEEINDYIQSFAIIPKGSTHTPYKIFLALWNTKQEIVAWQKVIGIAQQVSEFSEEEIQTIIEEKLCSIGLMSIHISNFADQPIYEYIRLCDPHSKVFFCEYITRQLSEASIAPNTPLTLYKELKKKDIVVPDEFVIPYITTDTYTYTPQPDIYDPKIFSIDLYENMFYFTNLSTPFLLDTIIVRLDSVFDFAGSELFFQLHGILGIDKIDLQMAVSNKKTEQLYIFVQKFYDNIDQLAHNTKVNKYPEFLDYVLLLYHLLPMFIEYKNKKSSDKQKIKKYTETLLHIIFEEQVFQKYPFETLVANTLKNIYPNEDREVIHEQKINFLKKHIINVNEVKTLNTDLLIDFQEYYIFSRSIQSILINQYSKIKIAIQDYLLKELKKFLLGKISHNNSIFYNASKTEEAIVQYLFKHYPEYYTITKHQKIVWLALKTNSDTNITDITPTRLLSLFIHTDTKRMFKWVEILNINLRSLYMNVNHSFNFLQKFLMFIRKTNKKFFLQLEKYYQKKQ